MYIDQITGLIIGECIKIHREYGPGLFESVYEEVLSFRLIQKLLQVKRQVPIPVICDGKKLDAGFRADVVVEDLVIVEIKSVDALAPVHTKQLLTYLRLSGR